jgi:stage V sporulation protein R
VERFLDAVLAIEDQIDYHFHIRRESDAERAARLRDPGRGKPRESAYDDLWKLEGRKSDGEDARPSPRRVTPEPDKDMLLFLAEHAPHLEDWQRDILLIVREEMQYFVPQMQTKVMNEGFASLWHARILRELDLTDSEYTEFAQLHSGVLAPNRMHINPYHLGYRMYEDIERRWDNPTEEQRVAGMPPGQGRAKIFEVRELENDVSFLRNYLTKELVEDLDLYIYRKDGDEWVIADKNWEHVRDSIVANMTVDDADYNHNTELLIRHHFEGQEMDLLYAEKTLEYVHQIWGRPVHLETVFEDKKVRLSYNGEKHTRHGLDRSERGER